MLDFHVSEKQSGKKLVRVICQHWPHVKSSWVYRALRQKDIRVNGQRINKNQPVSAADHIEIFGIDPPDPASFTAVANLKDDIIYQDENLLILNKKPGISVHDDPHLEEGEPSLITAARKQLDQPELQLCHRLDRQTGGLLILARSPAIRQQVQENMEKGLIIKRYQCLVKGIPMVGTAVKSYDNALFYACEAWLEKVAGASTVYIHDHPQPGDQKIITRYRTLKVHEDAGPHHEPVSRLEVELVTGRTHQIRAHLAHLGHPLLGDGKYGRNEFNQFFHGHDGPIRHQQLVATSLYFDKKTEGPLAGLAGKTFRVKAEFAWPAKGGRSHD